MFEKLIDRIFEASWQRVGNKRREVEAPALRATIDNGPPPGLAKTFTVHEAMNGKYIEYMRRKYNPNGPDDYAREIYIVQPGESLIDAISTVLVILEK